MPPLRSFFRTLILTGVMILFPGSTFAQITWYVDDDYCPGPGTGSQADPFCAIHFAVNVATDGDTIAVAPGTYLETIDYSGKAVTIESTAGPEATTIRAGQPFRVVRFAQGEGPDSVLDGFTITEGNGGISCLNSSPTIRNCVITSNTTDTGAGIECYNSSPEIIDCSIHHNTANVIAGGINCNAGSSPTITRCAITENHAAHGGGMYIVNHSSPVITQCTISDNSVDGSAGGISSAGAGSVPIIDNCVISGNTAVAAGGINCGDSSPIIINSIIEDNVAAEIAGGINCKDHASPTIANCTIRNNTAILYNGGAIICNLHSNATITDCVITSNQAVNGGAMYILDNSSPTIEGCLILSNMAGGYGGGLVLSGGSPRIDRCTIAGNTAAAGAGIGCSETDALITNSIIDGNNAEEVGGGVLCNDSNPILANCVLSDNSAGFNGGGVHNWYHGDPSLIGCTLVGNSADRGAGVYAGAYSHPVLANCILWNHSGGVIYRDGSSSTTVSFSDVQGGWSGVGNISAAPAFVGANDYRLSAGSPCIDAGDNGAVPSFITADLDGFLRFEDDPDTPDTGQGSPPIVDLGAYEYWPDCNGNGVPDRDDLASLTSYDCNDSGIPDECEPDSDGDGLIDDCDDCPNDPEKTQPGVCGCGVPDTDDDGDSTPDCHDLCPGVDDAIFGPQCANAIPTVSTWGLIVLALLLLTAGKVFFARRLQLAQKPPTRCSTEL